MLEYFTEPGESVYIRCQLASGDTGLYPQCKIYSVDAPTTVYDTLNLTELSNGLYGAEWTTPSGKGKYFTQTIIYTNAGHTTASEVDRPDSDSINVGRYQGGGYIGLGGSAGAKAVRTELTKEEIEKIAKFILSKIEPSLSKIESIAAEVKLQKLEILNELTQTIKSMDNSEAFEAHKTHIDRLEESVLASLKLVKEENNLNFTSNKLKLEASDVKINAVGSLISTIGDDLSEKLKKPTRIIKPTKVIEKEVIKVVEVPVLRNDFYDAINIGDFIKAYKIMKGMPKKEKEDLLNSIVSNPYYKKKFSDIALLEEFYNKAKGEKQGRHKNAYISKILSLGFTEDQLKQYA